MDGVDWRGVATIPEGSEAPIAPLRLRPSRLKSARKIEGTFARQLRHDKVSHMHDKVSHMHEKESHMLSLSLCTRKPVPHCEWSPCHHVQGVRAQTCVWVCVCVCALADQEPASGRTMQRSTRSVRNRVLQTIAAEKQGFASIAATLMLKKTSEETPADQAEHAGEWHACMQKPYKPCQSCTCEEPTCSC